MEFEIEPLAETLQSAGEQVIVGLGDADGRTSGRPQSLETRFEHAVIGRMLHVFDVRLVSRRRFRVPLHGGTVVPDLLLMKTTEKIRVSEEQTILDQNDLRRRTVETGMILKQLIGKDQKGFGI